MYAWIDRWDRIHFAGASHPRVEQESKKLGLVAVPISKESFLLIEHAIMEEGLRYPTLGSFGISRILLP